MCTAEACRDERDLPVEPPGQVEVAVQRSDGREVRLVLGLAVVRLHHEHVSGGPEDVRHVEAEGRERPLVLAELPAVQPHVGHHARAVELQPVTGASRRRVEREPVPAAPPLVGNGGVRAGRVVRVPGVRQAHGRPAVARSGQGHLVGHRVVLHEPPAGREGLQGARLRRLARGRLAHGARRHSQGNQQAHQAGDRRSPHPSLHRDVHRYLQGPPPGVELLKVPRRHGSPPAS